MEAVWYPWISVSGEMNIIQTYGMVSISVLTYQPSQAPWPPATSLNRPDLRREADPSRTLVCAQGGGLRTRGTVGERTLDRSGMLVEFLITRRSMSEDNDLAGALLTVVIAHMSRGEERHIDVLGKGCHVCLVSVRVRGA